MAKQINLDIKESESELRSLLNSQTKVTSISKGQSFVVDQAR